MAKISKEKQIEIRDAIIKVAKHKFVDIGFENTSTKEIAKEVGIAEGTLFNYFDSKTELFFEAFAEIYQDEIKEYQGKFDLSENMTEIVISYLHKTFDFFLKIPKSLMMELIIAMIKMAKNHPDRFKKLLENDIVFMDQMNDYVALLQEKQFISQVDTRHYAEIIMGIISFEFMMYFYENTRTKEQMYSNIKIKLDILLKGYLN